MSVQQSPDAATSRFSTWPKIIAAFAAVAVVGGVLAAGVAMPALGAAGAVTNAAVASFESLPDELAEPTLSQRTVIVDAEGGLLGVYWGDEGNRITVPLSEISPYIQQAVIAVEDARFYEHNGVDVRGTVRAFATNSGAGEIQQGGSTITQQYVKLVLLTSASTPEEQVAATERTPQRKLREASYAISLEKTKTKDEILGGYLNIAYYGAGAHGIEVAAERYFGVRARDVNLPQAALLAGVVQQPGAFDPLVNPEAAQQRRNVVLGRMLDQGMITQQEFAQASETPIKDTLKPQETANGCPTSPAPYFCDYVLQSFLLNPAFGANKAERANVLDRGGLVIRTTLEPKTQAAAKQATLDAIPATDPSGKAVAISMVQPGTGRILAMAQNRSWGIDGAGVTTYNYNVDIAHGGTQGMQAGSTFKVFTMMAALENGISPYKTINSPEKKTFYNFRGCDGARFPPYEVENSTRSGVMNMYTGTALSVNTYYVGLAEITPLCRMAEIAEGMGVTKGNGEKLERVPSFPLGSNEVTPLGMAGAYAAIANHGRYCKTHGIAAVERFQGRDGREDVYKAEVQCNQVVSERVADTAARILVNVVESGTGRPVQFGRPVGGKTGTTDSNAAVWFNGFTPQVASAVWVGDPRGGFRYPLRNLVINGQYVQAGFGSTLAGPVFKSSMIAAHEDLPWQNFDLSASSRYYTQPRSTQSSGAAAVIPQTPAATDTDD
jgi:membrane peptidoglycan carboxypeptidase